MCFMQVCALEGLLVDGLEVAWAEGSGLGRGGGRRWRDRFPYCQALGPIHYMAIWRSIITWRQTSSLGP
jgi:hypothetical protein